MLKGLYPLQPINEKTLGFEMNDHLLYIEPHPSDKNWIRVANRSGVVGLVPTNYVDIDKQVTTEEIINFIDDAITNARLSNQPHNENLILATRKHFSSDVPSLTDYIAVLEEEDDFLKSKAIFEMNNKDSNQVVFSQQSPTTSLTAISTTSLVALIDPVTIEKSNSKVSDYKSNPHQVNCKKDMKCYEEIFPERLEDKSSIENIGEVDLEKQHVRNKVNSNKEMEDRNELADYENNNPVLTAFNNISYCKSYTSIKGIDNASKSPISGEYISCTPTKIISSHQSDNHSSVRRHIGTGSKDSRRSCSNRSCSSSSTQSRKLAVELIQEVRSSTGLSHEMSQVAVQTVLKRLQANLERDNWSAQMDNLLGHLEVQRIISKFPSIITKSPDAKNLLSLFDKITEHKDNEQQRSWGLHEDESIILEILKQINIILNNADPSISNYVMEKDCYKSVHTLVLYYQMETRWPIRNMLLDNFAVISTIDNKALSVLLNSILPMELAREVCASYHMPDRMSLVSGLLVILLRVGEPIPVAHFENLGVKFVDFVFDVIEKPPKDHENITDEFMNLLFAYNLQFTGKQENVTITALAKRSNASVFTQKLIYFLNRDADPLALFDDEPNSPNSVFKLTMDVFSSAKSAQLFYINDIKVLIDIVTRSLTDFGSGDKRRNEYLKLIRLIMRNSNFNEHHHRHDDIVQCFTSILLDEDHLALTDQQAIRDIANEFPNFFSKR